MKVRIHNAGYIFTVLPEHHAKFIEPIAVIVIHDGLSDYSAAPESYVYGLLTLQL